MKKLLFLVALTLALFSCKDAKNLAVSPADYDFSEVFTYGTPFRLGIIGEDYTRLQMHYASVTKKDAEHYAVTGYSKVGDNVQLFEGTIEIKSIQKVVPEVDDGGEVYSDHVDNHDVYVLECDYDFGQADGTFSGRSINEIYFKDGKVFTDDCYEEADGYDNNSHIGTFTPANGPERPANWSVFRVPDSEELDQGVGEFVPSEKFRDNGWASYYNSIFNYNEDDWVMVANARYEEARKWWDPEEPTITAQGPRNLMDSPLKTYEPDTYFIEASTPKGVSTIIFPTTETPEYADINFDGYKDLYQADDGGYCYLYDPELKEFVECPSYNDIQFKGYLAVFPSEKVLMTSHSFLEKGEFWYYLYKFEDGKFVQAGSVVEKNRVLYEYDKDGNLIHQGEYPSDLSRIWGLCFAG